MKKAFLLPIIILTLIGSFGLSYSVLSIGQMTKPIIVRDVLRGQEITDILKIFNSESEEATYRLKAEGSIEKWASFYKIEDEDMENSITEIQIPPESYIDVTVKFNIPGDIPNGEYSGEVAVISVPKDDPDTGKVGASVFQRIGREVLIAVTDREIVKLDATIIPLKYGVKEGDPLKIKIIYDNQGNISVKPEVQLKITKDGKSIFNAIFPYPEGIDPIKPRERRVIPLIEWLTAGQKNGRYQAEVEILYNNKVMEKDDFHFTIGTYYDDNNKLFAAVALIGGGNLILGWFIIGTILLAVAGVTAFITKKRMPLKIRAKSQKNGRNNKTLNDIH